MGGSVGEKCEKVVLFESPTQQLKGMREWRLDKLQKYHNLPQISQQKYVKGTLFILSIFLEFFRAKFLKVVSQKSLIYRGNF